MNQNTCLVLRYRSKDGLVSKELRGSRLGRRQLTLFLILAIIICFSISRSTKAADASVEVFAEDRTVTNPASEYGTLFPLLPFRWFVTINGGYDDNVNTTPDGGGSAFTQANVTLSKELRTTRTQLSVLLNGGVTYYFDQPGGDSTDYNGSLNLLLQHGISERLSFAAAINAAYRSQPDFTTDLASLRRSNYFTTLDTFAARYLLSQRLSTYTSYQFGKVDYEDEIVSAAQDRVDNTLGESIRYRLSERSTLLGEYRFELIDYDTAPRDSTTHLALGGFEYQFSPRFNGSLLGGATFRKFKEGDGEWFIDPNASAALNYFVSPTTSLGWTASYSVEEPNFSELATQTTVRFRTGLRARYQPNTRVTVEVGLDYHHDKNTGILNAESPGTSTQDFDQNGFEFVLEGKYALADRLALNLKYAHTDLDSIGGYRRNIYTAGFLFNF